MKTVIAAIVAFASIAVAGPALAEDPDIGEPVTIQREAPAGSHCPDLYPVTVDNWPDADNIWPTLDYLMWRESRCRPRVVNRVGCVGLLQICRSNFRRLGVTRAMLQDPATNIRAGYQLAQESVAARRSPWRPWWVGRFRP